MEFKVIVLISCLGVAASLAVPTGGNSGGAEQNTVVYSRPSSEADSLKLPPSLASTQEDSIRTKRHLKWKKGSSDRVVSSQPNYDTSHYGREVHYYHHYPSYASGPRPSYYDQPQVSQGPRQIPPKEYHLYHPGGGYDYVGGGPNYYNGFGFSGGYYPGSYYGDEARPMPPPVQTQLYQGPVAAKPTSSAGNNVSRGQGAAAVNNIAIISGHGGPSSTSLRSSGQTGDLQQGYKVLPKTLPVDVEGMFRQESK